MNIKKLVSVKPSPIQGNGVFADVDIVAGTELCYYDGVEMNSKVGFDYIDDAQGINAITYGIPHPLTGNVFVGYDVPKTELGIAQLINDGCMLQVPKELDFAKLNGIDVFQELIKRANEYNLNSMFAQNCMFYDNSMTMIATKDIKKGDELYYHYGHGYWVSYFVNTTFKNSVVFKLMLIQLSSLLRKTSESNITDELAQNVIEKCIRLTSDDISNCELLTKDIGVTLKDDHKTIMRKIYEYFNMYDIGKLHTPQKLTSLMSYYQNLAELPEGDYTVHNVLLLGFPDDHVATLDFRRYYRFPAIVDVVDKKSQKRSLFKVRNANNEWVSLNTLRILFVIKVKNAKKEINVSLPFDICIDYSQGAISFAKHLIQTLTTA